MATGGQSLGVIYHQYEIRGLAEAEKRMADLEKRARNLGMGGGGAGGAGGGGRSVRSGNRLGWPHLRHAALAGGGVSRWRTSPQPDRLRPASGRADAVGGPGGAFASLPIERPRLIVLADAGGAADSLAHVHTAVDGRGAAAGAADGRILPLSVREPAALRWAAHGRA
jgi:hypothetical protein